jgi:hypothetical protein
MLVCSQNSFFLLAVTQQAVWLRSLADCLLPRAMRIEREDALKPYLSRQLETMCAHCPRQAPHCLSPSPPGSGARLITCASPQ